MGSRRRSISQHIDPPTFLQNHGEITPMDVVRILDEQTRGIPDKRIRDEYLAGFVRTFAEALHSEAAKIASGQYHRFDVVPPLKEDTAYHYGE